MKNTKLKKALRILFYIYLIAGTIAMLWFLLDAHDVIHHWARYPTHPNAEQFLVAQGIMTSIFIITVIACFVTKVIIKRKTRYIVCLIITVPCLIASVTIYVKNTRQVDKFISRRLLLLETMSQDVSLWRYEPFAENTMAARLPSGEESTLRLTDDLPNLDGATAFYPVYASFVQAVYPEGEYSRHDYRRMQEEHSAGGAVACTTTPVAYERLINGETDMIFTFAASQEHIALAEEQGVELKFTPIGKEAFVFFVNAKNPVTALTSKQIRQIYSGGITNWGSLGGFDKPIRAYQRNVGSGSQTVFLEFMGDMPLIEPASDEIFDEMSFIINETAYRNHDNALGYSFRYFATEMAGNNAITLLEIDGIAPTFSNIENGSYPLIFDFYAVTAGSANPNVELFIEWILSEQGRYLIEQSGYVPK